MSQGISDIQLFLVWITSGRKHKGGHSLIQAGTVYKKSVSLSVALPC